MLNAADFGDLLLECTRLFRKHPEVLRQHTRAVANTSWWTSIRGHQLRGRYLWLRLLGQSTGHDRPQPARRARKPPPACG